MTSVTVMISIVSPYLLIPIFFACLYLVWLLKVAKLPMIEAQRFDGIVRGPIHQLFATLITGLVTVRAYETMDHFKKKFIHDSNKSANVTFTYILVNRWLGMRVNYFCLVI